jgi:hypothetical protein
MKKVIYTLGFLLLFSNFLKAQVIQKVGGNEM